MGSTFVVFQGNVLANLRLIAVTFDTDIYIPCDFFSSTIIRSKCDLFQDFGSQISTSSASSLRVCLHADINI